MVSNRRNTRKMKGGALSDVLPTTSWGPWASHPGALAWSATTQAPPALANGGLYTSPQSTGEWASRPFPATQYAMAVEAAQISNNPDVFFQQRPNDNNGASFSPYVGVPASPQHYSATMGTMGVMAGGRSTRKKAKRTMRKRSNRKISSRKH